MALKLIPENDSILHQIATPVDLTKLELYKPIIEEMFALMKENHGIGLAAPQVGISERFFIMFNGSAKIVCFNPEIIAQSDEADQMEEGCLSFKDKKLWIIRRKWVKVSYYDLNGNHKTPKFIDNMARCFQHEFDHIEGVVFTSRG